MKSIVTNDYSKCFICGKRRNIHIHHIFYGTANRKKADADGLIVPLCADCHTGTPNGVHHHKGIDLQLKKIGQRAWMEHYHKTEADFIAAYGKNWTD